MTWNRRQGCFGRTRFSIWQEAASFQGIRPGKRSGLRAGEGRAEADNAEIAYIAMHLPGLEPLLERAEERLGDAFESCITDKTRELFGGVR